MRKQNWPSETEPMVKVKLDQSSTEAHITIEEKKKNPPSKGLRFVQPV